jgi:F-type H+-transporting ATPase subunit gamma
MSRSLGDIIDVLKTAALIQFRIFQAKEKPQDDFLKIAESCLNILLAKGINHPYLYDRKSLGAAIVIVTSDEGFLGELNTLLVNAGVDLVKSKEDEIIVLGERGARYLEDMGLDFVLFPGITDNMEYKEIETIRNHVLGGYRKKFGRIFIVYPKFLSLVVQKVQTVALLPFAQKEQQDKPSAYLIEQTLVEPTERRVLESLVQIWAGFTLTHILWSAKQSEYSARIMHLEGSTQELSHLNHKLSFDYFRQVHILKDKSIREISATKILLGRK